MPPRLAGIKACVFDAYGTLFDVNAAAAACRAEIGERWQAFSDTWRQKQLAYTWLRSLMGHYVDFWQVTGDALDFAMAAHGLGDPGLRQRLMDLYLRLTAYAEVPDVLGRLKRAGFKTAILSNGSPAMLEAAVRHAGIADRLDAVLSVDGLRVYKPDPRVYRLAVVELGVRADEICFQSSNAWDAHAAKAYGFRVVWCNRSGQAPERLPGPPDVEVATLADLPALVGAV
jgi:2-haloacid dehalogenase